MSHDVGSHLTKQFLILSITLATAKQIVHFIKHFLFYLHTAKHTIDEDMKTFNMLKLVEDAETILLTYYFEISTTLLFTNYDIKD